MWLVEVTNDASCLRKRRTASVSALDALNERITSRKDAERTKDEVSSGHEEMDVVTVAFRGQATEDGPCAGIKITSWPFFFRFASVKLLCFLEVLVPFDNHILHGLHSSRYRLSHKKLPSMR